MSGIVGLIRTDGAEAEPALIRALTDLAAPRGPDGQAAWCDGPAALGHTALRTGRASGIDRQPLTLDGQTWIVADARADARDELLAELDPDPRVTLASATDAELILRAYLKWGDACVDHLLGDYAFAVWDAGARRLFCARDQMGVKPFYYARVGPWLLVSNALESLRGHPAVSSQLDDLAIADFLLFGFNQDPAATTFRDIRRLPAAHTLTWSTAGLLVRKYWTLPIEEPVYYRSDSEYLDRFKELLRQAVSDRLRTERVGVFMSGGLDSPALAAAATELLGRSTVSEPVHAFTYVHEPPIPDDERGHAALAAESLGIPIHYYVMDETPAWPRSAAAGTPEPTAALGARDAELRCHADMARHSRIAFYGEGPDNALLYEWRPYLAYLWRRRQWGRLVVDGGKFLTHHKRVPLLPGIPRMIRARLDVRGSEPVFPEWMAPELVKRLQLRDRWRAGNAPLESGHPVRPLAYASLQSPLWQSVFETLEPSYTGVPLEVRHPYVDIRVLRFLLSVPVVPWCRQKHLLRSASRGILPDAVLRRPKTPLPRDPDHERVRRFGLPEVLSSTLLGAYGSAATLSQVPQETSGTVDADLRFVALSHWLHNMESASTTMEAPEAR